MATITIVEDYIIKAIQRAQFKRLEDGSCTAWVPGFPGLIALGADGRTCVLDLWRRLDEWLQISFEEGLNLPVIDAINLNDEEHRMLAAHDRPPRESQKSRCFEAEDEFFKALEG